LQIADCGLNGTESDERWMDEALAEARHAGPPCVTVAVDSSSFLVPIHIGELVTMVASVNHFGRTSMEVGMKVAANRASGFARRRNG